MSNNVTLESGNPKPSTPFLSSKMNQTQASNAAGNFFTTPAAKAKVMANVKETHSLWTDIQNRCRNLRKKGPKSIQAWNLDLSGHCHPR
jgi:hypothetical protein